MDSKPLGRYAAFVLKVTRGTGPGGSVVRVALADGREIGLKDGSYTIRVWMDPDGNWVRGTIRRESSGHAIHFQSGDRVAEFVRGCLIGRAKAAGPEPDSSRSKE